MIIRQGSSVCLSVYNDLTRPPQSRQLSEVKRLSGGYISPHRSEHETFTYFKIIGLHLTKFKRNWRVTELYKNYILYI